MRTTILFGVLAALLVACSPPPESAVDAGPMPRRDSGVADDTASGADSGGVSDAAGGQDAGGVDSSAASDAAGGVDSNTASDGASDAASGIDSATTSDAASGTGFSSDERALLGQIFSTGYAAADLARDSIALAADALWLANTTTGTLTQDSNGYWTWAASPADRMVLAYFDGSQVTFVFTTVNGYWDGSAEDFTLSHSLDFTAQQSGVADLRIQSVTYPDSNQDIHWTRTLTGSATLLGTSTRFELSHTGSRYSSIGSSFASYDFQEQYVGSATTPLASLSINESSRRQLMHNSSTSTHAKNDTRGNDSTATMAGLSYGFVAASASWAGGSFLGDPGTFNTVIDTNFWVASGSYVRDGTAVGQVMFDAPVVVETNGPDLVLRLTSGEDILLHGLLD